MASPRFLLLTSLLLVSGCSLATDFGEFEGPGAAKPRLDGGGSGGDTGGDSRGEDAGMDAGGGNGGGNTGSTNGGTNGATTGMGTGGGTTGGTTGSTGETFKLSLNITGPGSIGGDVTCATGKCDQMVAAGSTIVLRATASSDAAFGGWYGPCAEDAADGLVDQVSLSLTCTLSATAALNVTAAFEAQRWYDLTISRSGSSTGTVKSADGRINCDGSVMEVCNARYVKGSPVALSATAADGGTFSGWGGLCTGTSACSITMTYASVVEAVFDLPAYGSLIVTKSSKGRGLVESSPVGIACGESCSASYPLTAMQELLLAATAEENSIFKGFSGDCTVQADNATCLTTVDGVKRVGVEFAYKTYALTVAWAGSGAGSISGAVDSNATLTCTKPASCAKGYEFGTTVELSATPAAGSSFVGWSGGGCSGTGKCTLDVTKTTLVVANFAINNYTVVVGATGEGSVLCGSAACASQYPYGTALTLNGVPAAGFELSSWGGDCAGTPATAACALTVTKDTTVLATFAKKQYTLTVNVLGTASGSVSGALACNDTNDPCVLSVNDGDNLTLNAMAGPGAIFAGWSGACGGNEACSISNVSGDVTVTATFNTPVVGKKTLVVGKTGKGAISSAPAGISCDVSCASGTNASFDDGAAVELSASPATGYGAAAFQGCDTTNGGKCQITMNDSDGVENVAVVFPPNNYPVNVSVSGNGAGSVTATGITCRNAAGADCTENRPFDSTYLLTAAPDTGSDFTGWDASGPCAGVKTPTCEITVAQTNAVTATFTLKTYAVQWSTTGGYDSSSTVKVVPATGASGSACNPSATGACTYNYGTNVTLTAQPGVGSVFVKWTGDAAACGPNVNCNLDALSEDKTVTAEFATKTYEVSITVSGAGSVKSGETPTPIVNCAAGTCKATYAHGTTAALGALAAPLNGVPVPPGFDGVRFSQWGGDCSGGTTSCSLANITSNKSLTATFVNRYKGTLTLAGSGVEETNDPYVTITNALPCRGNNDPCERYFDASEVVTLTAAPPSGRRFAGWSGVTCAGTGQSQVTSACTFTMNSSLNVTAAFARTWALTVSPTGSGFSTSDTALVTGPGISCNGNNTGCTKSDVDQGSVTLTAAADTAGRRFVSWSGVTCAGGNSSSTCTFALSQATTVTATFIARYSASVDLTSYDLALSPSSAQDITSAATFVTNAGGTLSCTGANDPCSSGSIDSGTSITLNAASPAGFRFHSWSGVTCTQGSTSSACTFLLDGSKTITARYVRQWTASAALIGTGVGGRDALVSARNASGTTLFNCMYNGSSCSTTVDEGTQLTFSATPPAWANFSGFSGGCVSNTTPCTFTVSGVTTVNASFGAKGALVFVTEKDHSPVLNEKGNTPANICAAAAQDGGFDNQAAFIPWISTTGFINVNAISRYSDVMLGKATIVMVDGTQLTDAGINSILTGGSAGKHQPISITEFGNDLAKSDVTIPVWTGTDGSGLATSNNCDNWSGGSLSLRVFGTVGNAAGIGVDWTSNANAACTGSARIYCFQDPYVGF